MRRLLGILALASRPTGSRSMRRWLFLAGVFLFASIDEIAQIHEAVNETLEQYVEGEGALEHPWVVPGAIAVVALAYAYRGFVAELAAPVRRLLILGATLYVAGAVGFEAGQGLVGDVGDGFASGLVGVVEEFAEMAGVVFILEALLLQVAISAGSMVVSFGEPD